MGFVELIKHAFTDGYASSRISVATVLICIVSTVAIAAYIYLIYKTINKNSFYNRNFNLSLVIIAIITAAIILTIQSNIVVSLGMVGALSIVRFRTAIKDPMDLVFLFWSISVGIICGAGFAMIAIIASAVVTVIIFLFAKSSAVKGTLILVVNADSYERERDIINAVNECTKNMKVRARTVSKDDLNMAIEIRTDNETELIEKIMKITGVENASLVEHDGDVTV